MAIKPSYEELEKKINALDRAEETLYRRDAILEIVSIMAEKFLKTNDLGQTIQEVLELLGQKTGASRTYIFVNTGSEDGTLLASQEFEWVSPGIHPQIDNPELQNCPYPAAGMGRWEKMLGKGELIQGHIREFPVDEQEFLRPQGIQSLLVVPVFAGKEWYGFMGFDECGIERKWFTAETDALRTAAGFIGWAIKHKRAEKALQESEEKYRDLVENLNDVVYFIDHNGIITEISLAIEIFGYHPSELIGRSFFDIIYSQDYSQEEQDFKNHLSGHIYPHQFRVLTKTGEIRWMQASSRPILKDGSVMGLRGVLNDITEKKIIQDRLIRSERLAATGALAASIAHEINSPLQGIIALLGGIKETHKKDKELAQDIDLVRNAFDTIRDTVKTLLNLNRPGKEKKQPVHINHVVAETVALVRSHLKQKKIKVDLNLSPNIPYIKASPQQLGQTLMNLINNAVEAITGKPHANSGRKEQNAAGGTLTIHTCFRKYSIAIEVADTGPGIPEEDIKYIFDPFFTRKKTMGMGVGLSICHGFIADHNGTLSAKNRPEGGAVFTITLPLN